ncbi:WD40-repeat-containing domain protein [Suillus ampliporus]|nr:WD40-repeat-containing domain protein [Suillus ampliporus]
MSVRPTTPPNREFEDHTYAIRAVAVFPDRRRMVTASFDKTLRLWDLRTGVVLRKMEGHRSEVLALAVSRDGQLIASGDNNGEVIAWHGETGEPLTAQPIQAHSSWINSLDLSPDGTALAIGTSERTMKLWSTTTWEMQGDAISCSASVRCVRYSPSGELLAVATDLHIEIYNPSTRECVAKFKDRGCCNMSLAWTPNGTRLLSTGDIGDPTIREWDTSTWQQAGDAWRGHDTTVFAIAIHPAGILVASASYDHCIRLWRLSDQRTIAIFRHSSSVRCVTFSMDGKHILSGGEDKKISEWAIPEGALQEGSEILAMNTTVRNVCIAGDLSTAEGLLTQDISIDANNYTLYASRSFVMARKHHWDHALQDAITSVRIRPSSTGYISKGIALFGKGHVRDAIEAFDFASRFTDEDSKRFHFILLIKARCIVLTYSALHYGFQVIAMFNADQHEEAILHVRELAATCHNDDTLPCRIVEAYLLVRLGMNAMDNARHNEAADHFTAAVNSSDFPSTLAIHSTYEDLVVLFGWDLKSLWQTARQKQCDALLLAAFKEECSAVCLANGDAALAASDYDRAIDLYSVVINLNSASETAFVNRSKANSEKMLWENALLDAQKVIELSPWSHRLRGAQHYDEAIDVFKIMLSKLDGLPKRRYAGCVSSTVSPSEAEDAIRSAVWIGLEDAPLRLLHTSTGLLCDRAAQLNTFKMSTEYKELLSFTTNYADLRTERIKEVVVKYFRCVLLSHRWEETESLLHDIQDEAVYELNCPWRHCEIAVILQNRS